MFVEERRLHILDRLRAQGKVTVEELTATLGVSAPTVRADLADLEARQLLRRTHGGALPAANSRYEPPFAERAIAQNGQKRLIGFAAACMVLPGETILLDAGTTCHEVGLALAARPVAGVTVVTNNLPTALALMDAPHIETIVIGGQVEARRRALLGPLAIGFLKPFRADRLFMGVSGVNAESGFTAADFEAASMKQEMIAHAAHVVAVADYTKIGQTAFAHVAPLSAAALLLTDSELETAIAGALVDAGLGGVQRA